MHMNRNELLFNDKSKSDDKNKNGRSNLESLIKKKPTINLQRKPAEWYQNVYQKNQSLWEYGEINFNLEKNIKPKYNCQAKD